MCQSLLNGSEKELSYGFDYIKKFFFGISSRVEGKFCYTEAQRSQQRFHRDYYFIIVNLHSIKF